MRQNKRQMNFIVFQVKRKSFLTNMRYKDQLWIGKIFKLSFCFLLFPLCQSHAPRGPQASSFLLGNPLSSPTRFVPPTGQLGHGSSLPPLLPLPVSNCVASSPSPATSGGVPSVFRDSRFGSSSWSRITGSSSGGWHVNWVYCSDCSVDCEWIRSPCTDYNRTWIHFRFLMVNWWLNQPVSVVCFLL